MNMWSLVLLKLSLRQLIKFELVVRVYTLWVILNQRDVAQVKEHF